VLVGGAQYVTTSPARGDTPAPRHAIELRLEPRYQYSALGLFADDPGVSSTGMSPSPRGSGNRHRQLVAASLLAPDGALMPAADVSHERRGQPKIADAVTKQHSARKGADIRPYWPDQAEGEPERPESPRDTRRHRRDQGEPTAILRPS